MKKILAAVTLLLFAVVAAYYWPSPNRERAVRAANPDTQRSTLAGQVVGSKDADNTFAWLGIPYAAAPIGDLRWRAPQPVEPWGTPRETIAFSDPCAQLSGPLDGLPDDSGAVVGSEDCLYLNVWSPRGYSTADSEKRPVMFWIHGGGNTIGTANTYAANKLAAGEQVVLVTLNYRLGFFGWMSHPALRGKGRDTLDGSGNYANLDMIAALQWVQDNIANFGGDPNKVTIFGESAGGRNVYSLMASPLAKGLFQRAISQSGSVSTTPRWRAENFHDAAQPGMKLSSREWLSLQLQHAGRAANEDEAKSLQTSMSGDELRRFMYSRSTEEVLEGISGGAGMYSAPQSFRDGTVLPRETLYTLFRDPKRYNSVPLITGTNRDEMKLFLAQNPEFVDLKLGFIPKIKDPQAYNALAAYLSDNWKALAVDGVARIISNNGGQAVYAYRWDWDEGGKNWLVDYSELLGAGHGLEVGYIFNDFEDGIKVPGLYNSDNIPGRDLLGAQMRSYWSEFADTGAPGRGRSSALPLWQAWDNEGQRPNLMLLDTAADGGLRMVKEPMTVGMLKERVTNDTGIADLRARCALYVQLFLLANAGADVWNKKGYEDIGCAEFEPWSLEVSR